MDDPQGEQERKGRVKKRANLVKEVGETFFQYLEQ